jgi:microcystin-dependent protein
MISEKNVMRGAILTLALGFVGLGYNQTRARADGIPGMLPLTYAGQLEEAGVAVNGTRNLRLTIWDDATSTESGRTRCITTSQGAVITAGRFQVVLDNACTGVVRSTPDLWLEIEVNGSSLGRTKLSAVPFAIEASRASGLTAAAANALIPTGTIVAFGGATDRVPTGWLPCDGRSVTRAMYPELFDALGTAHGGNGTNFNLPDYRGRFLRGVDSGAMRDPDRAARTAANSGGNTGDAVGSVEGDAYGSHRHGVTDPGHSHVQATTGGAGPFTELGTNSAGADYFPATRTLPETTGVSIQAAGGAETRPVNAAVNFIIKL